MEVLATHHSFFSLLSIAARAEGARYHSTFLTVRPMYCMCVCCIALGDVLFLGRLRIVNIAAAQKYAFDS